MMYMIGDEVVHNGQTYVSLINYNDCALDNYLAWKIKKEERNFEAKMRSMTDYIDRQAATTITPSKTIKIPETPTYTTTMLVDISTESINKIAEAVVEKLRYCGAKVENEDV